MKLFKILICVTFVLVISACHDKKTGYDYPDNDPATEKGSIGDPCEKNTDCKEGLLCTDKVCSEPVTDKDTTDNDTEPDGDEPGDDADDKDDADSDSNDHDSNPTDDTDTGTTDEDEPEDTDTKPDEDETPYVPECGNGARDAGEECDNGTENSDEPGIPGVTCRTTCIFARCQDGIVDQGEVCDDGNASYGDYCSPDCNVVTGYCGDGIQQANEECDPGENPYCADDCSEITGSCGDGKINGNEVCDNAEPDVGSGEGIGSEYCNVNCSEIIGSCGDGIVQLNEECDDGGLNGRYGYCKSDCSGLGPYCGDGIKQDNEACDDGNRIDNDYCSADCQTVNGSCGDGIVQSFEACDKATYNQGTGIYCSDDCDESYGKCGDGIRNQDSSGNWLEECDDGTGNGNLYCEYGSAATCEVCDKQCKKQNGIPRYCGDGLVSKSAGEACDKANFGDGIGIYYCSDDCKQVVGRCGDGILQPNEECDPGIDPYCSDDCKPTSGTCGDGVVNGDEECDNGANNGNTECQYGETTVCTVCDENCRNTNGTTRYCGDGMIDTPYEICDSGSNNGNYGYCKTDCTDWGERCGDGIKQDNEACDEGANNGKTDCDYGETSCKVCKTDCTETDGTTAYCGDGIINGSESCDDGELNGTYGHCQNGCYGDGERCGDGVTNGSEVCDDGEAQNGQYGYCASDCMSLGRRCGDGITETANGEFCDDGENNGKYKDEKPGYCNATCTAYGDGGYCGDGIITEGRETCDFGEGNNGKTNCAYGETSCDVCSSECLKQPGKTSYCGDGDIDYINDEVCDKGTANADYNGECNTTCSGQPPKCGDGHTDADFGEVCDEFGHNGEYGLDSNGDPHCSSDCRSFGSGGWCGDGETNGYETCDSGAMNGAYGGLCNDTCTGFTSKCGDGFIDSANGESCDDGDANNGKYGYCNAGCTAELKCGDGIRQNQNCLGAEGCVEIEDAEEECDNGDANGTATDCAYGEENCTLCTDSCTAIEGNTAYCNDGILQRENCEGYGENCVVVPGANEECDDGTHNGEYGYCAAGCGGNMPKCGDGIINRENCEGYGANCVVTEGINEECDDGGENGSYEKCNLNCTGIIKCGDGVETDGEFCDDGMMNGIYTYCNEYCTAETGHCGDGVLQKEISTCGSEPGCVEVQEADEECDNGSAANGNITDCAYGETSCSVCTASCKIAEGTPHYCGNSVIEDGENCDDGGNNGTFGHCDSLCRFVINYRCGDGKVQKGQAEHCGDMPLCTDSLTENCCEVVEFAQGDLPELCDEGALNNTPGHCNSTCNGFTFYCGDGQIQRENCEGYENCEAVAGMNEECDDGGSNGYYGFCKEDCSGKREERCGDGIIQTYDCTDHSSCYADPVTHETVCQNKENCVVIPGANEECDEGINNGRFYGHCDTTCSNRISSGYCGDGKIQKTSEECSAFVALDPANNKICDENITENCCEIVEFAQGEPSETCDDGSKNGIHHHCNETCDGTSYCGDGVVGKDELCEPNALLGLALECNTYSQFSGGTFNSCNSDCMPILTGCTYNPSYSSPFFRTGQTKCYGNSAEITPCPANGEDFYGQEPDFNYTAQNFETTPESETVTETVSGLTWQKATLSQYGYEKESVTYYFCEAETSCSFEEAAQYCSTLSTGGYHDWRLPTATEFSTIMDYTAATHIYSVFTGTKENSSYWTQEKVLFSTADGTSSAASSSDTAQIKCVRSANPECSTFQCRTMDSYNLISILHFSNAMITYSDDSFVFWYFKDVDSGSNSWEDALEMCNSADNLNGVKDMRLPTVNELSVLFNRVDKTSLIYGFSGTAWTSTTLNGNPSKAYTVDFSTGNVATDSKTNNHYVICVE